MSRQHRKDPWLWAAGRIQRALARNRSTALDDAMSELLYRQRSLEQCWRRIEQARNRGWALAARRLLDRLPDQVYQLQSRLNMVPRNDPGLVPPPPSLHQIHQDLLALEGEFEAVEVDRRHRRIAVTTLPIELEKIDLGPFAIQLHLDRLHHRQDLSCIDCVALEPNPAASNESVTHPHVKDNSLCGGEASVPIALALRQGRVLDAMLLVSGVLQNYNGDSPYISLDDWSGASCGDCGHTTEDLSCCEHCQNDYCDHCISVCDLCDTSCCHECLERDEVSKQHCCPGCRQTCGQCDRTVDTDSFIESAGLCPGCHQQEQEHENNQQQNEVPATVTG
jgi:hypothetical protein